MVVPGAGSCARFELVERYGATVESATLLASGRAADVYDLGDGTVLRRYRIDHDVADEARLITNKALRALVT